MQTFFPVASTVESLNCLDNRRLLKQAVEAKQIYDVVNAPAGSKPAWRNHPAAVMWRQYKEYLGYYYSCACALHITRGGKLKKLKMICSSPLDQQLPYWFGNQSFHDSHKSRLLFKGKLDVLADRIKIFTKKNNVNAWLKQNRLPTLNVFREPEYQATVKILDLHGVPQSTKVNHYLQFNWNIPDNIEYIWPGEYPNSGYRTIR